MKKLILHVGHGKCASSSLQAMLSRNFALPFQAESGENFCYAALKGKNGIVAGPRIRKMAERSSLGYIVSEISLSEAPDLLRTNLAELKRQCGPDDTVILSNEGWCNPGQATPDVMKALQSLDVPIDVIMFVRPPVDWFNSGWWQWGAWMPGGMAQWYRVGGSINFLERALQWKNAKGITRFAVYDISQGTYERFFEFLGISGEGFEVADINVATNFRLLRHLVLHREKYGRTVHDPAIEFRLNALLQLPHEPPPFIVPPQLSRSIIHDTRAQNLELVQMVEKFGGPLKPGMRARYLNPKAYGDEKSSDLTEVLQPDPDDELIGRLIDIALQTYPA